MIPVLSSEPQVYALLDPAASPLDPLTDYEMGGVALNDPSQGLYVKQWVCRYADGSVRLSAHGVQEAPLFSMPNVTEVSLAFDQNMRPFVAYVTNGEAWFYWYDTQIGQAVHTQLPSGSTSPRCCLDDHRALQLGNSDIILAYIRNGNLYCRVQRDRYGIEYLLVSDAEDRLFNVGMQKNLRLQFLTGSITGPLMADHYVQLCYSDDGGRNWSNIKYRSLGEVGEYAKRIRFHRLGRCRNRIFKVSVSSPCKRDLLGAVVSVRAGVR